MGKTHLLTTAPYRRSVVLGDYLTRSFNQEPPLPGRLFLCPLGSSSFNRPIGERLRTAGCVRKASKTQFQACSRGGTKDKPVVPVGFPLRQQILAFKQAVLTS